MRPTANQSMKLGRELNNPRDRQRLSLYKGSLGVNGGNSFMEKVHSINHGGRRQGVRVQAVLVIKYS